MAITVNFLDAFDVFLQIQQNLRGLQRDIRQNALAWKAKAQAQSPPFAQLKQEMMDAASAYAVRTQWVAELRADPAKRQRLLDMLSRLNIPEQDIIDKATDLNAVITQLQGTNPQNYAQINTIADQIIAAVPARPNLWPE